jgi:hypothetical protein
MTMTKCAMDSVCSGVYCPAYRIGVCMPYLYGGLTMKKGRWFPIGLK